MASGQNSINNNDRVRMAVIANDVRYIKDEVHALNDSVTKNYATNERVNGIDKRVQTLEAGLRWLLGAIGIVLIAAFFRAVLK